MRLRFIHTFFRKFLKQVYIGNTALHLSIHVLIKENGIWVQIENNGNTFDMRRVYLLIDESKCGAHKPLPVLHVLRHCVQHFKLFFFNKNISNRNISDRRIMFTSTLKTETEFVNDILSLVQS